MIDYLKEAVQKHSDEAFRYAELREQLQLIILDIISKRGYFNNISFLGGTALRIIYRIRRYSEDLDFSLQDSSNYEFPKMIELTVKELELRGFEVDIKMKRSIGAVRSCFFRFKGVLHALGLSPLKDQKIAIKFEVDENPPTGFTTELSMINEQVSFSISHFDLASAFAGKIHAILARQYTKGRDYFDLLWFLGRDIKPNLEFLNNGLKQTYDKDFDLNMDSLESMLIERIKETDYSLVCKDLEPFIMDPESLKHYDEELFVTAIKRQFA
ncbi:MAG: nucleotidyl transferase AbiEii/AbiGii toxin family protein [Candidatus Melainabacteria bacterium]|nr:nucleotidyl transferase AbiEii/AbiGii toxin family protein [Candidatus Melainabacteria bacterium]